MGNDTIRLPGGKVMTRSRAFALGLVDKDGNLNENVPADSQAAKVLEREARRAEWVKTQRLDEEQAIATAATMTRGQKAAATRAANKAAKAASGEPETDAEGRPVVKREPKPLKPGNVDADGQPVTDPETLAKIAAETEDLEARKAAERAAAEAAGDANGAS